MTLDRVEKDEYVLQNSDFKDHSPGKDLSFALKKASFKVLRILLKNPYYDSYEVVVDIVRQTQTNLYEDDEIRLKVVNEDFKNMEANKWHLLPHIVGKNTCACGARARACVFSHAHALAREIFEYSRTRTHAHAKIKRAHVRARVRIRKKAFFLKNLEFFSFFENFFKYLIKEKSFLATSTFWSALNLDLEIWSALIF